MNIDFNGTYIRGGKYALNKKEKKSQEEYDAISRQCREYIREFAKKNKSYGKYYEKYKAKLNKTTEEEWKNISKAFHSGKTHARPIEGSIGSVG